MDTCLVETGNKAVHTIVFDDGLPLFISLSYLFALAILIGAIAISIRWLIKRTQNRDPTPFAVAVLVQLLFFILFNTLLGMQYWVCALTVGAPDEGAWYLMLAQTISPLLGNMLLCLFSLALVSLTARRLPRLQASTILLLGVVLLDVAVYLTWTTHAILMRR
jgi:hypothetical protein